MIGIFASCLGLVLPSTIAGSSPSPIKLIGTTAESMKNRTSRAPTSPLSILLRSRAYTPIPYSVVGPNSRVVITYESLKIPYFG